MDPWILRSCALIIVTTLLYYYVVANCLYCFHHFLQAVLQLKHTLHSKLINRTIFLFSIMMPYSYTSPFAPVRRLASICALQRLGSMSQYLHAWDESDAKRTWKNFVKKLRKLLKRTHVGTLLLRAQKPKNFKMEQHDPRSNHLLYRWWDLCSVWSRKLLIWYVWLEPII